jgi:hypothetical protein
MFAVSFSTGKRSLISWAIRKMTGSKVSHAFLAYRDETLDDLWLLEADRGGFQAQRRAAFERDNVIVIDVPVDIPIEAVRAADRWVGDVGYDYEGLIGNALAKVANWCRLKVRSVMHSPRSMFCSEAMVRLLQLAKYPGAEKLVPWKETPEMLLEFMLKDRPDLRAKLAGVSID